MGTVATEWNIPSSREVSNLPGEPSLMFSMETTPRLQSTQTSREEDREDVEVGEGEVEARREGLREDSLHIRANISPR